MRIIISILMLQLLFSCSGKKVVAKNEDPSPQEKPAIKARNSTDEDLEKFLKKFEQVAVSHNKIEMLELIDKDYKKEQHDLLMKGNTERFLDEFFCNYQTNGQGYLCIKFNEITEAKQIEIMPNDKNYTVVYHISGKSGTIKMDLLVLVKREGSKTEFGFYGH